MKRDNIFILTLANCTERRALPDPKTFLHELVLWLLWRTVRLAPTWSSPMQFHCSERRLIVWLCRSRRPREEVWCFRGNANENLTECVNLMKKGLYEVVWSSNEYLTVFPLILFPFMKTVFTEVLLMSPWIKFYVLTSCTYNTERWQRCWWLQQGLHLVRNDITCISVLRLSEVRRQSDKSSWKYLSRDSK